MATRAPSHRPTFLRMLGLAGMAAYGASASIWSPKPAARIIRRVFDDGAAVTVDQMERYADSLQVPVLERTVRPDEVDEATAHVFTREDATGPQPTIIWMHGGAWISGSKDDVAPYLRILAAKGLTAIGVDYPVGPEKQYPDAIRSLVATVDYLLENADALGIDPARILLAGDSAGAQLAAQLAAMITDGAYAREVGITAPLTAEQLRGTILFCGVYDLDRMHELSGIMAWGFKMSLWAYTGQRDWASTRAGREMSVVRHVTAHFPPTFISAGDADELTASQSLPMRDRLVDLGVPVTEAFFPSGTGLPHEYQFHLDERHAQGTVDRVMAFVESTMGVRV